MKLSNVFILIISLLILAMAISAQSPGAATESNCFDQLKANNYTQAIEVCSAVIAAKDNSVLAYRYRGLAYISAGGIENFSKAETDFRKCTQLNQADVECQYWLGYSVGWQNNLMSDQNAPYFKDNNSPDDNDTFSWETTAPSAANEMRFAYRESLARNDGYNLLRLAKIENDKQQLPEIKAGDILYESYRIAVKFNSSDLLLNIAKFENQARLMSSLKAGDILYQAVLSARARRDARSMIRIAVYENGENLIAAKAGDILYEAYIMAKNNRDIRLMLKIADYEAKLDLMAISPDQIRREAIAVYR